MNATCDFTHILAGAGSIYLAWEVSSRRRLRSLAACHNAYWNHIASTSRNWKHMVGEGSVLCGGAGHVHSMVTLLETAAYVPLRCSATSRGCSRGCAAQSRYGIAPCRRVRR